MKMDRRTIVLVAVCVLFLLFYYPLLKLAGFGRYLEPAPRPQVATVDSVARDSARAAAPAPAPPAPAAPGATAPAAGIPAPPVLSATPFHPRVAALERAIHVETPLYRATFSSRGARIVSVELKRYATAHGIIDPRGKPRPYRRGREVPPEARVVLGGGPIFGVDLGSGSALRSLADVPFAVRESLDAAGELRTITFTAEDSSGLAVRETYRVRPQDYGLELEVEIHGVPAEWRLADYSLTTRSWPLVTEENQQSDERTLRATSLVGTNIHRESAGGLVKAAKTFDGSAAWAAVQTRYFLGAVAVRDGAARGVRSSATMRRRTSDQLALPGAGTRPEEPVTENSLLVGLPAGDRPTDRFLLYFGPSEYFVLTAFRLQLERAVDLGWSWILPFSHALLWLMNQLYALLANYGLAIIALATLVRVVLHPLNMASMKSMRAMQRLQPEIERLRAKYKNDSQAMNTALMALYKENKVNPAGGCLPMLVQMPIFFALYQVLFNAIELRQAAFVAWMHDLSAPDHLFSAFGFPVRLLPLLMAGSGLLQQKMAPTDPRQQTSMYMMNVVMVVFFYNLPSGLVLYWTVMNLLTALQQWLVLRQDGGPQVVVIEPEPARAGGGGKRR
jgi:YidC/Oxa1 family membrane protein insertase